MIERDGSLDALQAKLSTQTAAVQGSGWAGSVRQARLRLPPLPTKTRANRRPLSRSSAWTFGSTRTTLSTRTCAQTIEGYLVIVDWKDVAANLAAEVIDRR